LIAAAGVMKMKMNLVVAKLIAIATQFGEEAER
jgi:hypothetical protein